MDPAANWLRSPSGTLALDVAMVAAVFAVGVGGQVAARNDAAVESAPLSVAMVVCAFGAAASLWWRRQRPMTVFAAVLVWTILASAIDEPGLFSAQTGAEVMIGCFAVGAWSRRRRGVALSVVAVLFVLLAGASARKDTSIPSSLAFALALVALPAVAGVAARTRRQYLEEVEHRLSESERERDVQARRAVLDERTRIARELHDVVAHHVSLIGVQAGAARIAMDRSPERAIAALTAIEESSREAVQEMRHLLDALRPLTTDDPRAPQPALERLPALVERVRAVGYEISLEISPEIDGGDRGGTLLSEAASLSAYRVVEEALTNVTRHSLATRAYVRVHTTADVLTIDVGDPGPARPYDPGARPNELRGGRGRQGMQERVAIFGGTLRTGPTPDGGFRVVATFPRRST